MMNGLMHMLDLAGNTIQEQGRVIAAQQQQIEAQQAEIARLQESGTDSNGGDL